MREWEREVRLSLEDIKFALASSEIISFDEQVRVLLLGCWCCCCRLLVLCLFSSCCWVIVLFFLLTNQQ
jgi:hypothetical protein